MKFHQYLSWNFARRVRAGKIEMEGGTIERFVRYLKKKNNKKKHFAFNLSACARLGLVRCLTSFLSENSSRTLLGPGGSSVNLLLFARMGPCN